MNIPDSKELVKKTDELILAVKELDEAIANSASEEEKAALALKRDKLDEELDECYKKLEETQSVIKNLMDEKLQTILENSGLDEATLNHLKSNPDLLVKLITDAFGSEK